jgi:hypothetical protein
MSGDEEVLRRLQIAPERNRLQKLNQALEDGMVEARYLDREEGAAASCTRDRSNMRSKSTPCQLKNAQSRENLIHCGAP